MMGISDRIKSILQKIKNSMISLINRLPFKKKTKSGSGIEEHPIVSGTQQIEVAVQAQQIASGADVQAKPTGLNQQIQRDRVPGQEVLQQNAIPPNAQEEPSQTDQSQQIDPAAVKLLKYIREYRQQGHSDEAILKFLMQHKWPEDIVRKALEFR